MFHHIVFKYLSLTIIRVPLQEDLYALLGLKKQCQNVEEYSLIIRLMIISIDSMTEKKLMLVYGWLHFLEIFAQKKIQHKSKSINFVAVLLPNDFDYTNHILTIPTTDLSGDLVSKQL